MARVSEWTTPKSGSNPREPNSRPQQPTAEGERLLLSAAAKTLLDDRTSGKDLDVRKEDEDGSRMGADHTGTREQIEKMELAAPAAHS